MSVEAIREALRRTAINSEGGDCLLRSRNVEYGALSAFVNGAVSQRQGGCHYVCGSVGCGKTELCTAVAKASAAQFGKDGNAVERLVVRHVNCVTQITDCETFLRWFAVALGAHLTKALSEARGNSRRTYNELLHAIEPRLRGIGKRGELSGPMVLCVVDEIDDILELPKGRELLWRVFRWTALSGSRLILVGIGNDPDLVSKCRPAKAATATATGEVDGDCIEPTVLRFSAYSSRELEEIIASRIGAGIFDSGAIGYVAKMTERMGGDVRTSLTMCREPLFTALGTWRRTGVCPPLPMNRSVVIPVVQAMTCDTQSLIKGLPGQSKFFLCAVLLAQGACGAVDSNGHSGRCAVPRSAVYSAYQQLCRKVGAAALTVDVLFRECFGSLLDLDFVRGGTGAIELVVDPDDVVQAMTDLPSLQKLLPRH